MMSVLADRIRTAYERTERGRHEWIEGTLELAAALAEAREVKNCQPRDLPRFARGFSFWAMAIARRQARVELFHRDGGIVPRDRTRMGEALRLAAAVQR
jgi:hypothetical protein